MLNQTDKIIIIIIIIIIIMILYSAFSQGGSSSAKYICLKIHLQKNTNKLFLPKRNTSANK